ncbi:MAG: MFS transporter [Candidatus Eisenbacteria bacterium]
MRSEAQSARRNYLLSVWNGVAFNVGETFIDPATVLALLVSQLTSRSWIVGLAVSLTEIGWYLPQILTIQFLERRSRRLPIYRAMAVVRVLGLVSAVSALIVLGDRRPELTLTWFLASFAVFAFAGGFSAVSFYDVVGRTVPMSWQPRMWAQRLFYGGLLSAACGLLVRALLGRPNFVERFGSLFALGTVFIAAGAILFTLADEPPVEVSRKEMHLAAHLRENVSHAWRDHSFRALFGTRVALAGAAVATPFLVLFAVRSLHLPAAVVGGFLTARIIGYVGANPLWRRVATRHGSRRLMGLVALFSIGPPLCALAAAILPAAGPARGMALTLAFAIVGATVSGTNIGYQSLLLAIAPAARRPSYVGLMNSFVGPVTALPALGGLLVDATRPEVIFLVAIACALGALGLARRLPGTPAEEARPGPEAGATA